MQPRLANCLSAAFAASILLLTPALAQVSVLTHGQGLSPEDNRLLFDSIARLNGTQPARHQYCASGVSLGRDGLPPGAASHRHRRSRPRLPAHLVPYAER
jgi:hypothetical protein